ncbi:MAG: single-stranded DNA-binding protein [Desulfobacterales bacterium]|jgi:single-strand selective monofunctional uracil DNA glycosylase
MNPKAFLKAHRAVIDRLLKDLRPLSFSAPVWHVYNPLDYGRPVYEQYLSRYGKAPKQVVFVGMNPGPWGMVQTGVPFGEIAAVRDWMGLQIAFVPPRKMHPKRPVLGAACRRTEASGKRLWGWAKERFGTADRFFDRFFVANYCPLAFIEESGRNRTPDHLKAAEKAPLFSACDRALKETIRLLSPALVVGIGNFAASRVAAALSELSLPTGQILHPSPANPRANRGWADIVEAQLAKMGVELQG